MLAFSFFQLQKELLDAELELFNAQQEGSENVTEIQKKVNALSIEAAKQGLLPTSRSPGARGGAAKYCKHVGWGSGCGEVVLEARDGGWVLSS